MLRQGTIERILRPYVVDRSCATVCAMCLCKTPPKPSINLLCKLYTTNTALKSPLTNYFTQRESHSERIETLTLEDTCGGASVIGFAGKNLEKIG